MLRKNQNNNIWLSYHRKHCSYVNEQCFPTFFSKFKCLFTYKQCCCTENWSWVLILTTEKVLIYVRAVLSYWKLILSTDPEAEINRAHLIHTAREGDRDRYRVQDWNEWVPKYCTDMFNKSETWKETRTHCFHCLIEHTWFTLHGKGTGTGTGYRTGMNGSQNIVQICSINLRHGKKPEPIVSYCVGPVPCTHPGPAPVQLFLRVDVNHGKCLKFVAFCYILLPILFPNLFHSGLFCWMQHSVTQWPI